MLNKKERAEYNKKWQQNNPEKVKGYRKNNKKIIKIQHQIYYQENKKEKVKQSNQWRKDNPEYSKIYRETHKKEIIEYRQNNKKKINKQQKQKRKTNLQFRLNGIMSNAIYQALKKNKAGQHWEDLVGYTLQNLIKHLESKFEEWMTWDNYGKWHIDHIKPQSLFKFETTENKEFRECWKLENLQPLEAIENIKKNNNY